MIGVAVAREDVVGTADNVQDSLFVSFPSFSRDRLLARKEGIDQDLGLSKLNFPPGGAEPLQSDTLCLRQSRAGFRFGGLHRSDSDRSHYETDH